MAGAPRFSTIASAFLGALLLGAPIETAHAQMKNFHREYLFQEGTQLLWLPVQDPVASYFASELHPGQTVTLCVVWFGAYYAGEDITWTFIVNDFKTERGETQ